MMKSTWSVWTKDGAKLLDVRTSGGMNAAATVARARERRACIISLVPSPHATDQVRAFWLVFPGSGTARAGSIGIRPDGALDLSAVRPEPDDEPTKCDACGKRATWTAGGGAAAVLNACGECVIRTENAGDERPEWERLEKDHPFAPDWNVERVERVGFPVPNGAETVRVIGSLPDGTEFRWRVSRANLLNWRYALDGATFDGVRDPRPASVVTS